MSEKNMRHALVTGASGFIGSALVRELAAQGVRVTALVHSEKSDVSGIRELEGVRIIVCDMDEIETLPEKLGMKNCDAADGDDRDPACHDESESGDGKDGCGIDVLYHLAWTGSAGPLRGDFEAQIKNIVDTQKLVRACGELGIRRLVFASSIMEYEIVKLMETELTPGINTLYCSAKLSADFMARAEAGRLGIDYMRAVISNIYGPGEKSPRLVNTSIRKLLSGEHCSFSPGEQLYDFIYIDDAARMFAGIGESGAAGRTYYIGTEEPRQLKEFLLELRDVVAPGTEIGLGDFPFSGVSLNYDEFDKTYVRKDTGVVPEVSFAEGIRRTAGWIQEGN